MEGIALNPEWSHHNVSPSRCGMTVVPYGSVRDQASLGLDCGNGSTACDPYGTAGTFGRAKASEGEGMKTLILSGIIPAMLSPLGEDESVDENGVRLLVEHLVKGGVDGIFVLGTAGEGTMLTLMQQRRLVAAASKAIRGRVPLLVGVSGAPG